MKAGGPQKIWFYAGLFFLLAGCRSGNRDLLENELRHREELYREALEEQRKAECRIDSLQREVEAMRRGGPPPTPEQAALALGVKRITLGRSTAGYDGDGLPGDEVLQVVVEPRDCDEHIIKAPGVLQVLAQEITPQGVKIPVSSWELGPEDLRKSWKQGLLSSGYTLLLPWKQYPRTESVRVTVRFIVADARVYEADKDVRVRVCAGLPARPPDVSGEVVPPPVVGPLLDTLPAPRAIPENPPPPEFPPASAHRLTVEHRAARPAPTWIPVSVRAPVQIGRPQPLP
jgi:hypothetical protein